MPPKQITIVAAVIFNEKREILIAQRNQPETPEIHNKWEFVGGGIEFGEDPLEAIKREVLEEIGLEVEVIRLLPKAISDIQEYNNGDRLQVIILTYECKIISGTPKSTDPEVGEIKFVPLEEVKNYNAFQNVHDAAQLLITNH